MKHEPEPGPDPGLVVAARGGDRQALERLLSQSLPLVYNIVGRALDGHGDVDDVVQDTLLRVVRGLDRLEQPESYRSWMVAITVRRIRDRIRERQHSRRTFEAMPDAEALPDASDFASLTILRLHLGDQRRELVEATRWLDTDDRELLSLWWLEESGRLARSELAEALGVSERHAAVRVGRLRERLDTGRDIVRAVGAHPPCPGLDGVIRGWDGTPSPLWRKRIARHLRECERCGEDGEHPVPTHRLLHGLPLVAPPVALYHALGELVRTVSLPGGMPDTDPTATPAGTATTDRSPIEGIDDVHITDPLPPRPAGHRRVRSRVPHRPRNLAVAGAAVAVAGVLIAIPLMKGTGDAPVESPVSSSGATDTPGTETTTSGNAPHGPFTVPLPPGPDEEDGADEESEVESDEEATTPSADPASAPSSPTTGPRAGSGATDAGRQAGTSGRKGVAAWPFNGSGTALRESGSAWYYTWATNPLGIDTPPGVEFVPMIWGADFVTPQSLAEAKAAGPYLLGFNEPDLGEQANMSVEEALALWPQLEATGSILGSPAVAYGGDTPGGWLDRFMRGAGERGLRVDFITLHWYGSDFRSEAAVEHLRSYLTAVHERYGKPIWLTEYALIDFSNGTRYPSEAEQAAFVAGSTRMLESLPFLERYAWFGLGTDEEGPGTALFRGSVPTDKGLAFRNAP